MRGARRPATTRRPIWPPSSPRLLGEWLAGDRTGVELEYELYLAALRRPALRPVAAEWADGLAEPLARRTDPVTARALVALLDGICLQVLLTGGAVRRGVRAGDAGAGHACGTRDGSRPVTRGPPGDGGARAGARSRGAPDARCRTARGRRCARRRDPDGATGWPARRPRRLGFAHDRHDCSAHHRRRRRRPRHHRRRRHRPRHLVPRPRARRRARPGRHRAAVRRAGRRSCSARAPPRPSARTPRRGVEVVAVRTVIASLDDKPLDAHDAYLRLHLLSHRLVQPHGQNLDGIFGLLANVAWTSLGPVAVDDLEKVRLNARAEGLHLQVTSRRQVPADDGLRRPQGRPDRRRRPGPARRAPRRGHHRHARGLRQLQRGHARHLHGRGPHLRGRRRRRRLRHRRRRLHHGHPVRRRQAVASPSASAA